LRCGVVEVQEVKGLPPLLLLVPVEVLITLL
jgi:hypothetical protein